MNIERESIVCSANDETLINADPAGGSAAHPADLRVISGISLITVSYILGWPTVAALAALSAHMDKPAVVAVGGPLVYGFSYIILFAGVYLVGKKQAKRLHDCLRGLANRFLMVG